MKILQTSSSHEPFEVPFRRLENPRLNAFAYADSCAGDFVRQFKETPLWKNTVIVLVPDHLGAYPQDIDNPDRRPLSDSADFHRRCRKRAQTDRYFTARRLTLPPHCWDNSDYRTKSLSLVKYA